MKRFLVFMYSISFYGCTEDLLRERIKEQSFVGIIDANYIDSNDRMASIVVVNGRKYNTHSDQTYKIARVGDSIIKRRGYIYYLVKHGDSFLKTYPDIAGKPLTE